MVPGTSEGPVQVWLLSQHVFVFCFTVPPIWGPDEVKIDQHQSEWGPGILYIKYGKSAYQLWLRQRLSRMFFLLHCYRQLMAEFFLMSVRTSYLSVHALFFHTLKFLTSALNHKHIYNKETLSLVKYQNASPVLQDSSEWTHISCLLHTKWQQASFNYCIQCWICFTLQFAFLLSLNIYD